MPGPLTGAVPTAGGVVGPQRRLTALAAPTQQAAGGRFRQAQAAGRLGGVGAVVGQGEQGGAHGGTEGLGHGMAPEQRRAVAKDTHGEQGRQTTRADFPAELAAR